MASNLSNKHSVRWFTVIGCAAFVPLFVLASRVHAQEHISRVRFDIGSGIFTGKGAGIRNKRAGGIATGQLTGTVWTKGRKLLLVGANVTTFVVPDLGDECVVLIPPPGEPSGGCLPNFPEGTTLSALAGFEYRLGNSAAIRLLAGPSLIAVYRKRDGVKASGALGRVDLTAPVHTHFAFVIWGEAGLMRLERTPSGTPLSLGLGLRIQ